MTHKVVQVVKPKAIRQHRRSTRRLRSALMDGFNGVVNDPKPAPRTTRSARSRSRSTRSSGKTGTAEVVMNKAGDISEHSVFVGMVTAKGHPYVVVSLVEQAGFGAAISAPIVRRVIEALDGLPLSTIAATASGTD